jgi:hypothetical protein
LQRWPSGKLPSQFFFAQGCVDFSMADAVNGEGVFAALAFGYQVVLINAAACDQRPAAQWAITQSRRHMAFKSDGLLDPLAAFNYHLGFLGFCNVAGSLALWCELTGLMAGYRKSVG